MQTLDAGYGGGVDGYLQTAGKLSAAARAIGFATICCANQL